MWVSHLDHRVLSLGRFCEVVLRAWGIALVFEKIWTRKHGARVRPIPGLNMTEPRALLNRRKADPVLSSPLFLLTRFPASGPEQGPLLPEAPQAREAQQQPWAAEE